MTFHSFHQFLTPLDVPESHSDENLKQNARIVLQFVCLTSVLIYEHVFFRWLSDFSGKLNWVESINQQLRFLFSFHRNLNVTRKCLMSQLLSRFNDSLAKKNFFCWIIHFIIKIIPLCLVAMLHLFPLIFTPLAWDIKFPSIISINAIILFMSSNTRGGIWLTAMAKIWNRHQEETNATAQMQSMGKWN